MIVLDTNVISAIMSGDRIIQTWLDAQPYDEIFITAITIYEIESGIGRLPTGAKRSGLTTRWRVARTMLRPRTLPLDDLAASASAELFSARFARDRNVEIRDTFIAGIARTNGATLATRNIRDFNDAGIALVDPWTA